MTHLGPYELNRVHLVMFSGGVSSFESARRCINTHGRELTELWFADTKTEDDDLYRFLNDCEEYLGVPIQRFAEGRDVWQVFMDEGIIGNSRIDPCSRILKREILWKERALRFTPESCVTVLGMDWSEPHRVKSSTKAHGAWPLWFPLCEKPYLNKSEIVDLVESLGIAPPRLTMMGFPHNNCGGFCIKAGHAHFAHLLRTFPERYAFHEQKELEWQTKHGKNNTILRDRRSGKTTPMSLAEFRGRVGCGLFDLDDWGGCGCFTTHEGKD